MRKEDLINNLKDLKTELIDPDIYKGAKAFDFLGTIDSLINLLESVKTINASQTFTNEQYYTTCIDDFEGMMKKNIAHNMAEMIKDKMDIIVEDDPFRCETTWTGTIYILDKKKGA